MATKTGTLVKKGSEKYPRKRIWRMDKYDIWEIVPDTGQDIAGLLLVDRDTALTLVSGTATITIDDVA